MQPEAHQSQPTKVSKVVLPAAVIAMVLAVIGIVITLGEAQDNQSLHVVSIMYAGILWAGVGLLGVKTVRQASKLLMTLIGITIASVAGSIAIALVADVDPSGPGLLFLIPAIVAAVTFARLRKAGDTGAKKEHHNEGELQNGNDSAQVMSIISIVATVIGLVAFAFVSFNKV